MIYEVVGVKKAVTGKGKDCFTYHFQSEFTDYEVENCECVGKAVLSEFSYEDFGVKVGDTVKLIYEKGFQDKATLSEIIPVKNPFLADGNKQDKPKQ